MARVRTVKPELAFHEELFELEQELGEPVRFAWTMLFCQCDKRGRFPYRPRRLKATTLPYDDTDLSRVLHAWVQPCVSRRWKAVIEHYLAGAQEAGVAVPAETESSLQSPKEGVTP